MYGAAMRQMRLVHRTDAERSSQTSVRTRADYASVVDAHHAVVNGRSGHRRTNTFMDVAVITGIRRYIPRLMADHTHPGSVVADHHFSTVAVHFGTFGGHLPAVRNGHGQAGFRPSTAHSGRGRMSSESGRQLRSDSGQVSRARVHTQTQTMFVDGVFTDIPG